MDAKNVAQTIGTGEGAPPRTDFTVDQANRVIGIMKDRTLSDDEKLARLLTEFETGTPVNGRVPIDVTQHQFESIIDLAWCNNCETVLLHMVEVDPKNSKHMYSDHCNFMFPFYARFPEVINKLGALGYTMAGDIGPPTSLGLYLHLMSVPRQFRLWPQMQAEGIDMNAHAVNPRDWSETLFISKIAQQASAEVLEKAIAAGCDPRKIGKDGNTILHAAIDQGETQAKSWRENNARDSERFAAICDFVLRSGLDIDMKDASGQSALHLCAKRGYADRAKILIEHGANPDLKDDKGRTPYRLAKGAKRHNVIEVFGAWRANKAIQEVLRAMPKRGAIS